MSKGLRARRTVPLVNDPSRWDEQITVRIQYGYETFVEDLTHFIHTIVQGILFLMIYQIENNVEMIYIHRNEPFN